MFRLKRVWAPLSFERWNKRIRASKRGHLIVAMCFCALLVAGFGVRARYLHSAGVQADLGIDLSWMRFATHSGISKVYRIAKPNHGPVEIGLYGVLGHTYEKLRAPLPRGWKITGLRPYLRIPDLLGDAGIATLLFVFFLGMGRTLEGLVAAAVYVFHPVSLLDVAWGQTDALLTFFLLLTVTFVAYERWMSGGVALALAYLSKPLAVALAPLLLFKSACSWKALRSAIIGGCIVLALFMAWFALHGHVRPLFGYMFGAPHSAPEFDAPTLTWWLRRHRVFRFLPFGIGAMKKKITFAAFLLLSSLFLWFYRSALRDRMHALFAAAVLYNLFYLVMWSMHERHNFPFIALGIPLLFISWEGIVIYVLTCTIIYAQMAPWVGVRVPLILRTLPYPLVSTVFLSVALFLWLVWLVFRSAAKHKLLQSMHKNSSLLSRLRA